MWDPGAFPRGSYSISDRENPQSEENSAAHEICVRVRPARRCPRTLRIEPTGTSTTNVGFLTVKFKVFIYIILLGM